MMPADRPGQGQTARRDGFVDPAPHPFDDLIDGPGAGAGPTGGPGPGPDPDTGGQLLFVRDGRVVELDPGLGPAGLAAEASGWDRADGFATLHGLCEACLALTELAAHEGRYLCEECRAV